MDYLGNCITFKGKSHKDSDKKCQDASSILTAKDYAIIAVGDGHGSHPHIKSHIGSSIAVDAAIAAIQTFVEEKDCLYRLMTDEDGEIQKIKENIITQWNARIQSYSDRYRDKFLEGYNNKDRILYGTTLICGIISKNFVLGLQIGDGNFTAIYPDGFTDAHVIPEDPLCHDGQTTSMCDDDALNEIRSRVWTYDTELIHEFVRILKSMKTKEYTDEILESAGKKLSYAEYKTPMQILENCLNQVKQSSPNDLNRPKVISKILEKHGVKKKLIEEYSKLILDETPEECIKILNKLHPDKTPAERLISAAKKIPFNQRDVIFGSQKSADQYFKLKIPVAISANSDGFGTCFPEDDLGNQSKLILSLMSGENQWYETICPYLFECTENVNEDDTSFAIAYNKNLIDFKKLYDEFFDEPFPFIYVYEKYPRQKVVYDGDLKNDDVLEYGTIRLTPDRQKKEQIKNSKWVFDAIPTYDYSMTNGSLTDLSFHVKIDGSDIPHIVRYEGEFQDVYKSGKGKEFIIEKSKEKKLFFEGIFSNDAWNGQGTRYDSDKKTFMGEYVNGK